MPLVMACKEVGCAGGVLEHLTAIGVFCAPSAYHVAFFCLIGYTEAIRVQYWVTICCWSVGHVTHVLAGSSHCLYSAHPPPPPCKSYALGGI